ncbi:MAG: hypothetical protein JNJ42_00045 [Burkholderiaceae bacterium]|nr:hypothetical protein [Burkholderiaceae bacterium]
MTKGFVMALCPKCHQPLADDEDGEYICCAGETLQWRCGQCAKVSEGFAFPYGLCPHCGGALRAQGATQPAGRAAALDALRTAFEIELGGRDFYRRAADEAGDAAVADLFARFAEMETEHLDTLARRYHVSPPDASASLSIARAAIYAGAGAAPDTPERLFGVAIALEERAAAYFAARADDAAQASPERELYRELAAEEREHASLLLSELERWRRGRGGQLLEPGTPG